MVEEIECLRAELERHPLVNRELLEQTHVPVVEARVVNNVSRQAAVYESARRGCGELSRNRLSSIIRIRNKGNGDPIAGITLSILGQFMTEIDVPPIEH